MSRLKYFSFLLVLSFALNACFFDFSDSDDKKEEDEVMKEEQEENDEDVVKIEVNGEKVEIDAGELEEKINNSVSDMLKKINNSLNENNEGGEDIELMDHRDLKSLLPSRLGWMSQTEHSSEKSGGFGFKVATAKAKYESGDKWIEIELTDLGGTPLAMFGLSFWDEIEVDRESKDEYEKTYTKDDNKYHEKYNKKNKEGEMTTVVKNRYVLNIEGQNVQLNDLEKARDAVKVKRLE